ELFEELDRYLAAARELADRHRSVAAAAELGERLQRVRRLGGDRDHGRLTLPALRSGRRAARKPLRRVVHELALGFANPPLAAIRLLGHAAQDPLMAAPPFFTML